MANLSLITFGDLINLAFLTAGIVGQGQSVGAQDMTNATQMLNAMLGQWQRRRYLVYYLEETSISATGAQSYSVGPGCDFNIGSRPSEINYAFARQVINANPNQIDYPLSLLPARETYAQVAMKQLEAFPQWAWYQASYPIGNLFVYPVITSQFTIYIGYPALLQIVTSLTNKINLPPEYMEALLYNLAVTLAGAYQLSPNSVIVARAGAALETLRTANAQVPQMRMPNILRSGARYNIYSDRSGPGNY
jgi:hypothetical protein